MLDKSHTSFFVVRLLRFKVLIIFNMLLPSINIGLQVC